MNREERQALEHRLRIYSSPAPPLTPEQRERMAERWRAVANGEPDFVPLPIAPAFPKRNRRIVGLVIIALVTLAWIPGIVSTCSGAYPR